MNLIFNSFMADENLYVCEIGSSRSKPFHKFGPILRNKYILHYVIDGEGKYNGETVSASEGFLIVPTELQTLETFNNPWQHFWIMFEGKKAEELLRQCGIPLMAHKFSVNNSNRIKLLFEKAMETDISGPALDLYFTSVFYELLSLRDKSSGHNINLTENAKRYIAANIHRKLSVEDIAKHCSVSHKYLCKLFQRCEGCSPIFYIQEEKFRIAKDLLISTQLPVNEIASSVGYEDPCYFSSAFKGRIGISPKHFREQFKGI